MKFNKINFTDFTPRYWSTWLFIFATRVIAYLPESLRFKLGGLFGKLLASNKKLYHVAERNLSSCFPAMNEDDKSRTLALYFKNQGMDLFETATIWNRNGYKLLENRVEVEGLDNLRQALKEKKGIILLASHFGNPDMCVMLMAYIGRINNLFEISLTFKEQENRVFNAFMTRGRQKFTRHVIPVTDIRSISRRLRSNEAIWYAPDMNVSGKNTEFIPFLGVQASTTLAISRLAKMTNCIVLPYIHHRLSDSHQYRVTIYPPLSDFPSDDPVADTMRINDFLGQRVSEHPENYWWVIKRFQTRPQGEKSFY